jgi:hypothetical protein
MNVQPFYAKKFTVLGFVQRGFQGSMATNRSQISKQLYNFKNRNSARCAKPLLGAVNIFLGQKIDIYTYEE